MADTGTCDGCGIVEHIHLLDGKRSPENEHDENADFDRLECVACYGPGWHPCAAEHIALSVAPRLTLHYQKWIATHAEETERPQGHDPHRREIGRIDAPYGEAQTGEIVKKSRSAGQPANPRPAGHTDAVG